MGLAKQVSNQSQSSPATPFLITKSTKHTTTLSKNYHFTEDILLFF